MRRGIHPQDRGPFLLVGIAGTVTVSLVVALALALFPSRPWFALGVAAGVCAPFAGIVAWGLHRTRVRAVLDPVAASSDPPAPGSDMPARFVLDLTDETRAIRAQRALDERRGSLFAAGMALVLGGAVGAGTVWWVGLALGGTLLALLPWMIAGDRARTRTLRALRERTPRSVLDVGADGLIVPVELLSGAEQWRALEAGELEVRLAWEAISRWEVWGAYDDIAAMHVLTTPETGPGLLSPLRRVGMLRTPTLRAREDALLAAVRRHLRCPIEVQGPPG